MKLTKITAMVAAIATAAGLGAVAASSANAQVVTDGEKTITLNATSADQLTGHTFKAVKVASYDVYGTAPNQSVTLKTEDGLKTDIAKYLKYTGTGDPLAWAQQQDQAKLDKSATSPWLGDGTTRGLADQLASKATTEATPALSSDNKQATFTLDSPGLWLIVDQVVTGKSSKALPILAGTKLTINNTVYSSGSIDMKNQTASVSKTVTDQTVAAGQDASYTITTKVPNYVGYKVNGYQFTVSDKFAHNAPLAYKTGTLKVTVDNKQLRAGTDYTVAGFDATSKTFIIDLSGYIKAKGFGTGTPADDSKFTNAGLVGKTVTVEYKATVTGSTGNTGAANTPTIKYPNDPSNNESKQEVPGTPVKVFNFDYTLVKKDKTTGAALEGAKFAIKNADGKYLAYTPDKDGNGKVIGEFVCNKIATFPDECYAGWLVKHSCVSAKELERYAGDNDSLYVWHISNLVIYDEPKELSRFLAPCDEDCPNCEFWKCDMVNQHERDMDCTNSSYPLRPLKRPPQSWCYVEVSGNE